MRKIFYKIFTVSVLVIIMQSCTTAVIDEGTINDLPPLTEPVVYNPDVENIMFNNCVTCHGGPAPSAGLDLTSYNNVKASAMSNLINRINDQTNPMPPNGLMVPLNRQKMQKWVDDNYPEN